MSENNIKTNVFFKKGLQSALPDYGTEGAFYLTTDSNRLYIGKGDSVPMALLNQTVQYVDSISALTDITNPTVNDFYYCVKDNVLATWNGTEWKQINKNTNDNTDTYISGVSTPVVSVDNDSNINVSFSIQQNKKDEITNSETPLSDIAVSFAIESGHLAAANKVEVGLTATSQNEGVQLKSSGAGAATGDGETENGVNILGGDNVNVRLDESKNVVIEADDTTYSISAKENSIVFADSKNNTTNLVLADDDYLTIEADQDTITVSHNTLTFENTSDSQTLSAQGKMSVITGLSTNDAGHITGYETTEYTLPKDTKNNTISLSAIEDGGLKVELSDDNNDNVTHSLEKAFYYILDNQIVYNQSELDVYTKEQVDNFVKSFNALVYKGTLGTDGTINSLPTENVENGVVYKVITSGTYNGIAATIGDLFIACGDEDEENGFIPTNNITWTLVPSGESTDTQYNFYTELDSSNKVKLTLKDKVNNGTQSVEIAQGDAINVNVDADNKKITIKHAEVTTNGSTENGTLAHKDTFTAIKSLTVNDQGHVTGYVTENLTLPGDSDTTSQIYLEDNTIVLKESDNSTTNVSIVNTDGFIDLESDSNVLTINHKSYTEPLSPTEDSSVTLNHGGEISVVTGVGRDAGGHITSYTTKKYTLPTEVTYSFSGDTVVNDNQLQFGSKLINSDNSERGSAALTLTSDTFVFEHNTESKVSTINLVWDTF